MPPAINLTGTFTYPPADNLFGTETRQVRIRDDGETENWGADTSPIESFAISVKAPRLVSSIQVNDGTDLRSCVANIAVTFDTIVSIVGTPTNAFQVNRTCGGAVLLGISTSNMGGQKTVTLAYTGGETEFGSLRDGKYVLTIAGSQVQDMFGQPLVGNSGGSFVYQFRRLFGDADGNGTGYTADFNAFRSAFLDSNPIFDFDNAVGAGTLDFNQFRQRFGSSV